MPHRDPVPELASSRITAVTVYQDGALVTRECVIASDGDGFPAAVRLANLPLSLHDGSIRVRVESPEAGASAPVAGDLRVVLDLPEPDERLPPAFDEEIIAARAEEARLRQRLEQLQRSRERLGALKLPPRPRGRKRTAPAPSPTAARLALLAFRKRELEALLVEEQATKRDAREARERREDLEARRRRVSSARQAREHELRKAVLVRLDSADASVGEARLVLQYLVAGARWAPAYTFKFDSDLSRAELSLRALVCQSTGEDWDAVRLTLSTARAKHWTELPELTSLRIGRRQAPRPKPGWRPPPEGAEALYGDFDRAFSKPKARPAVGTVLPVPSEAAEPGSLIGVNDVVNFLGVSENDVTRLSSSGALRPVWHEGEMLFSFDDVSELKKRAPLPVALAATSDDVLFGAAVELEDDDMEIAGAEGGGIELDALADEVLADEALGDLVEEPVSASPPAPECARIAPAAAGAGESAALGRASRARMKKARRSRSGPKPLPNRSAPAAPELEPLLEYGDLHMPPPEDAGRGKLVQRPLTQTYVELLVALDVSISVNLLTAILHRTTGDVRAVADRTLPDHYRAPEPAGGFDYAYSTESDVSLPSDGQFHSIGLLHREAESSLSFVAVPRESRDVFRFVELTNPLEAPLLAGPADILIGGDFLMTAPLRQVAPRGRIQLGLGVEQGIKAARNTHYSEETGGLMSGSLRLEHEIRVDVVNHLQRTITLEVRERIPVTVDGDEQAEVKVKAVEPAWERWRQEERPLEGGYRWKAVLGPGEERSLRATYVIHLPSKSEIAGGNRRES